MLKLSKTPSFLNTPKNFLILPIFAVLFGATLLIHSSFQAHAETNPDQILQTVLNYKVGQDNPIPYVNFNNKKLEMEVGSTQSLKLIDKRTNTEFTEDVNWFIVVRSPQYKIFTSTESLNSGTASYVSFDDQTKTVTAKASGDAQIVAVHQDYIQIATVKILTPEEVTGKQRAKALQDKTDEILANTAHLSDVEKVLYVYDYITKHTTYDLNYIYGGAYETLVVGRAACGGYTRAFNHLMKQLGIGYAAVGGNAGGIKHAWNRIKLDDGWYFIDSTWENAQNTHQYFLIDQATLSKSHSGFTLPDDMVEGTKYKSYYYKKHNLFAENTAQLEKLLDFHLNANNDVELNLSILVNNSITPAIIKQKLRQVTGPVTDITYLSHSANTNGPYTLYNYHLTDLTHNSLTNVQVSNLQDESPFSSLTTKLKFKLETTASDFHLNTNNITIENAEIESLVQDSVDPTIYHITLKNVRLNDQDNLKLSFAKRHYQFNPASLTIPYHAAKEYTPSVPFVAKDDKSGTMQLSANTQYNVGDGIWHLVTADSTVSIQPIYGRNIYLQKKGSNGKLDSEINQIEQSKEPDAPTWVKAINTTPNQDDGKLVNVNTNMEYQKPGDSTWQDFTANELDNLPAGKYHIRFKAHDNVLASETHEVEVRSGNPGPVVPDPNNNPGNNPNPTPNPNNPANNPSGNSNSSAQNSGVNGANGSATASTNQTPNTGFNHQSSPNAAQSSLFIALGSILALGSALLCFKHKKHTKRS